jgi:prepilin peptidase CpaA
MQSIAWWPILIAVMVATVTDLHSRRIPNWIVFPLLFGGIAVSIFGDTSVTFGQSMAGFSVGLGIAGALWWLGGLGAGDMKLVAAIGAWIGPDQLLVALLVTGLFGGVMAVLWALCYRRLIECVRGTGELFSTWRTGIRPQAQFTLANPAKLKMPYAPAIAVGTILSFFGARI